MTIATFALVAAVVAVAGLLVLLFRLRSRLHLLSQQVSGLQDLARGATARTEPPAAAVPVITGLPGPGLPSVPVAAAPGRVVSVTLAGPMIKVAALSHGLRRALDEEHRMRIGYAFRRELRRQRKLRRRAAGARPQQTPPPTQPKTQGLRP